MSNRSAVSHRARPGRAPRPHRARRRSTMGSTGVVVVLASAAAACSGGDDVAALVDAPAATPDTEPDPTIAPVDATVAPVDAPTDSEPDPTIAPAEATIAPAEATIAPAEATDVWLAPEGDYSVVFPNEPQLVPTPFSQAGLVGELELWISEERNAGFVASRIDYAELGVTDASQLSLEGARDGAVANAGGTLVDSQRITVQGRDAIRFDYTVQGGVGESLVVLDGFVMYQAQGVGTEDRRAELAAFAETLMFVEDR